MMTLWIKFNNCGSLFLITENFSGGLFLNISTIDSNGTSYRIGGSTRAIFCCCVYTDCSN